MKINYINLCQIDRWDQENNGRGLIEKLQQIGGLPKHIICKRCNGEINKVRVKFVLKKESENWEKG